jgi:hypothetical protein
VEKIVHRCPLDDLSAVHHRHLVRGIAHHAHIVGDQQYRQFARLGELADEVQHLLLYGQGRGGFVSDQDFRLTGQGHGDHHPLLLAAGQLVWVERKAVFGIGNAHLCK